MLHELTTALEAGATVTAVAHDDRGQRMDGVIFGVTPDGRVEFEDDERAGTWRLDPRDVVEWEVTA